MTGAAFGTASGTAFGTAHDGAFDGALAGLPGQLVDDRGARRPLLVARWHGDPDRTDTTLLDRCSGPALDVGCGPGRLAAELTARGLVTLGVDVSLLAVRLTRLRGAAALRRSIFDRVPGAGRWGDVLLADGNIGIGGDPVRLLERCAGLLRAGGRIHAELDPAASGVRRRFARVEHAGARSRPFAWATVAPDAVPALAAEAELHVTATWRHDGRCFAELSKG